MLSIRNRYRPGVLWAVLGEALWVVHAILWRDWALVFICVLFTGLYVSTFIEWGKHGDQRPRRRAAK